MYPDLICFSHLRWNFVYQRPQHLLSRFAAQGRVFFIEDAFFDAPANGSYYRVNKDPVLELWIVEPHLEPGLPEFGLAAVQRRLLDELMEEHRLKQIIAWYYTPMAMLYSAHLHPLATVYDCMDELSAFLHAPAAIKVQEKALLLQADLVFTGGKSLYEAKKHLHGHMYPFPSSIDHEHFGQARHDLPDPEDQAWIAHPRIGFYGVIDERLHLSLLRRLATSRPDWNFILIGPVVKIDPATLPQADNLHYLGSKTYTELPAYLHGWDIAMLPFAHNESTRFISPTKTPEYLAGGKPVISTAIQDVMDPYAELGLVLIADTTEGFISCVDTLLAQTDRSVWLADADRFLAQTSWDKTWQEMKALIEPLLRNKINYTEKKEVHV